MGHTAPAVGADAAQPTPGQDGAAAGGSAPYAQYLEQIPEEHRGLVEPAFRRWDADVTRRFQEASQYRDQWAPFEEAGIHEYDPAELAGLVQWAQSARTDPEQYKAWLQAQAQQHGLLQQPGADGLDLDDDPSLEGMLARHLTPIQQQMQEINAWRQQQEMAAQHGQVEQEMQDRFEHLAAEDRTLDPGTIDQFLPNAMAQGLSGARAVDRAVADYRALVAQVEQGFVGRKLGQPPAPAVPGAADTSPAAITSMKDAAAVAMERLKQQNAG